MLKVHAWPPHWNVAEHSLLSFPYLALANIVLCP